MGPCHRKANEYWTNGPLEYGHVYIICDLDLFYAVNEHDVNMPMPLEF